MYRVLEGLASNAIGEIEHPLPKEKLQTGEEIRIKNGFINERWKIVDCRDLRDDIRNPLNEYSNKINQVREFRTDDYRVMVCCGAGQSRSNAIILGYLVDFGLNFYDSLELIKDKVPICKIGECHLDAIKEIYGVTLP